MNGAYTPNADELAAITRRGTQIEAVLIARIDGVADVVLQDGRTLTMNGLFTQPRIVERLQNDRKFERACISFALNPNRSPKVVRAIYVDPILFLPRPPVLL